MKPMNIKIGERPMTRLEAKHRFLIKDCMTATAMIRYDVQIKSSHNLIKSFLTEMKDRRQLKLSVNNFIARSYTIQSRARL